VRITWIAASFVVVAAASAAGAQNPASIEHHLRYGVRLADQPDVALDLLDRMRSYHVPGVSIAVIDNYRVVFEKGYGVTEFLSRRIDQQTRIHERVSSPRRRS